MTSLALNNWTLVNFPPGFKEGDKICDFLFTFLHTKSVLNRSRLGADPFSEGKQTSCDGVTSLKVRNLS